MNTTHSIYARLSALFFVLLFSSVALAGAAKVDVCHVPEDNPDNFHTIRISAKALDNHLAHGDLAGACNAICADLCDDGNECTIDDDGDCEENGCPVISVPVDCDDGEFCTTESCDPVEGCVYEETCEDPVDKCVIGGCDDVDDVCVETPVVCDPGESCNPLDGQCEPDDPAEICPCFDETDLANLNLEGVSPGLCGADVQFPGQSLVSYTNGSLVCSGDNCTNVNPSCFVMDQGAITSAFALNTPQNADCRAVIINFCDSLPSPAALSSAAENTEFTMPTVILD